MRVLIADRRTEVRAALALLLGQEPGVEIGGQARDSAELLSLMETVRPDVVLLEWGLPGRPVARLVAMLHALAWAPRVLVLALREERRGAALAAGADAFASKDESPERLLDALRALQVEGDRDVSEPPAPACEPLDFSPKRTD
jgi:DNA-binding NarL/FixJ family response regulator